MENKVPRTPEDFEKYWRDSPEYKALLEEIKDFEAENPVNEHGTLETLRQQKNYIQAKHARPKSPYLISVPMQIKLNTRRAYQRIWGDVASTATQAGLNVVIALIVGSIYFGHSNGSSSFQGRGAVIFLAILFNALTSIGEISGLYAQRPIVEKHNSYAFYHPSTEAIAGIVADIPVKFIQAVVFNIILYFLAQLRYTAGQFFLFFIVTYMATFVMAAIFRTTAAVTKTASQAMAGAGVLVLILVIYTGFVIRIPQMPDWFGWIRWINPIVSLLLALLPSNANTFSSSMHSKSSSPTSSMGSTSLVIASSLQVPDTPQMATRSSVTLRVQLLDRRLSMVIASSRFRTRTPGAMFGATSASFGLS
jgi:ABC-type multidrug transport system permease subunit